MNRQKLLLSVLLLILAISIGASIFRMPKQKSVEKLTFPPGTTAKATSRPKLDHSQEIRVRLDLLERKPEAFSGFKRNIFGALVQTRVEPRPRRRSVVTPSPIMPPPQIPQEQPSPVQRDMAQFTFMGFLKKENRKTVFLASNNQIYLVKKGDTIAGNYQVIDVTDEMMTIRALTNGGEIIIPLVENRPLM